MTNNKGIKWLVIMQALLLFTIYLTGCGLPQYDVIEKPIPQTQVANLIGFKTPSDSNIIGYALYYKIYDKSESTLISDDKELFNPSNYNSSLGESIPTGKTLLTSRQFKPLTKSGNNLFISPILTMAPGGGDLVEINFVNQDVSPKLFINSSTIPSMELNRGSKGSRTINDNNNAIPFLSFVLDYDYTISAIDNDLINMISRLSGAPTNNIVISVCAYSIGLNYTTMSQLESEPVFLGTLDYSSFASNGVHD